MTLDRERQTQTYDKSAENWQIVIVLSVSDSTSQDYVVLKTIPRNSKSAVCEGGGKGGSRIFFGRGVKKEPKESKFGPKAPQKFVYLITQKSFTTIEIVPTEKYTRLKISGRRPKNCFSPWCSQAKLLHKNLPCKRIAWGHKTAFEGGPKWNSRGVIKNLKGGPSLTPPSAHLCW